MLSDVSVLPYRPPYARALPGRCRNPLSAGSSQAAQTIGRNSSGGTRPRVGLLDTSGLLLFAWHHVAVTWDYAGGMTLLRVVYAETLWLFA